MSQHTSTPTDPKLADAARRYRESYLAAKVDERALNHHPAAVGAAEYARLQENHSATYRVAAEAASALAEALRDAGLVGVVVDGVQYLDHAAIADPDVTVEETILMVPVASIG